MGCTNSKEAQACCSCCGCCACCITPPSKAVLYDEDDALQPQQLQPHQQQLAVVKPVLVTHKQSISQQLHPQQTPYLQPDLAVHAHMPSATEYEPSKSIRPGLHCLGSLKATGVCQPGAGMQEASGPGQGPTSANSTELTSSDASTHANSSPFAAQVKQPALSQPLSQAPAGSQPASFCMPSMPSGLPSLPGFVGACLSSGMNPRSLRALRAHLNAKGFAVDTSSTSASMPADSQNPHPHLHVPSTVARTEPTKSGTRWHSMLSLTRQPKSTRSGVSKAATAPAAVDPAHIPAPLPAAASVARSSNMSWTGLHDAMSHPDESEDWMDIIDPEGEEEGAQGTQLQPTDMLQQLQEETEDDAASDVGPGSTSTFLTCCSPPATLSPSHSQRRTFSSHSQNHHHPPHHTHHHPHPHHHHHHQHTASRAASLQTQHSVEHPVRRAGISWQDNVHRAQASIAQEDLALAGGEQHPALAAFKQGTLGWAFSGGGFWFPYSLGCVIQLKDMGIITDRTPMAGASCGAIITACVNSGLDLHQLVFRLLEFAADCRTYGTAGRLKSVIEKFMRANLPPDAHHRCTNKTYISITKVFPYLRPWILDEYDSKEDLVCAIATSCHIPAYNDGAFMARFRNTWCVDGGLMRHIPRLPGESGATHVAGVSCVPFKFLESLPGVSRLQLLSALSVSPDMFETFPFPWQDLAGLVLAPAEDPVLLQMVEMGKRDIKSWAAAVGLTQHLAGMDWVPAPPPPVPEPLSPKQRVRHMRQTLGAIDSLEQPGSTDSAEQKLRVPAPFTPVQSPPGSFAPISLTRSSSQLQSVSSQMPSVGSAPAMAQEADIEVLQAAQELLSNVPGHKHARPPLPTIPSSTQPQLYTHTSQSLDEVTHDLSDVAVGSTGVGTEEEEELMDWHDAVEEQYSEELHHQLQAVHPAVQPDGQRPKPEAAVLEGLYAATEAVVGPLHMEPQQAIDALVGGASTLHLIQHATQAPLAAASMAHEAGPVANQLPGHSPMVEPTSSIGSIATAHGSRQLPGSPSLGRSTHMSTPSYGTPRSASSVGTQPLPVLQLSGGKLRSTATSPAASRTTSGHHSTARPPSRFLPQVHQHQLSSSSAAVSAPMLSPTGSLGSAALPSHSSASAGQHALPSTRSSVVSAGQAGLHPVENVLTADIDVDAAQAVTVTDAAGDAVHTVQLLTCVGGQPVQLKIRLHMPQAASPAASGTAVVATKQIADAA